MPVDDESRERLLLGEDVVQRTVDLRQLGAAEPSLLPQRRVPRRGEEAVLVAKRDVQGGRQVQDHRLARRGAPGFEEAQMALRGPGDAGKLELGQAATLPPPSQPLPEIPVHRFHHRTLVTAAAAA